MNNADAISLTDGIFGISFIYGINSLFYCNVKFIEEKVEEEGYKIYLSCFGFNLFKNNK